MAKNRDKHINSETISEEIINYAFIKESRKMKRERDLERKRSGGDKKHKK